MHTSQFDKPTLAITMGDPGGVGPEVIAKTFQNRANLEQSQIVLFGSSKVFEYIRENLQLDLPIHPLKQWDKAQLRNDCINFIDVTQSAESLLADQREHQSKLYSDQPFEIGKISHVNAAWSMASLQAGIEAALSQNVQAIVTGPVNKTTVRLLEPDFLGHTEVLAETAGAPDFAMMFVSSKLRVTLATIHIALKDVSQAISTEVIFKKIQLTHVFLKKYFQIDQPRLAVCALNPHGAETGDEDELKVRPAVSLARAEGMDAVGPLSGDQIFYEAYSGNYDAVISMYHDQGLAPFKMVAFKDGVNVTLGLPYIRTSPDHGTAFGIAYQNKADADSFGSALSLAQNLSQQALPK